ncbi:amino acid permease-domain-containing protein [Bipolaris maydis]|nr:amino acid permease-domain-containing protein [Bipolaris maydis]
MTTFTIRPVAEEPVTASPPDSDYPYNAKQPFNADEEALAALGYKSEFKREFSLFATCAVSFAILGLLPSFASTLFFSMGYAGTAGMAWGWPVAMIGIQCYAYTSGGMYYAAAVLAPPAWAPFASWVTCWSNWLRRVSPTNLHTFLLASCIMIIHGLISSMPTRWLAQFNSAGSTFNFLAVVALWGTIHQGTSFPPGICVLMSFIGVIWTMSGYSAPIHLSEECSNASVAAPRAILATSTIGGILGWALQLVVAYTVVDIPAVIASPLGQPFAACLMQCMTQKMALCILALTVIAGFTMGQGCMLAASRVTFAYPRDDVFPGSDIWKAVNPYTKTPVNAVWGNAFIGICLLTLIFGGDLAVGALFSIGGIAASFAVPISIRVLFVGDRFRPGPWNLGKYSIACGTVACSFVALMIPVLCFPSVTGPQLTAKTMNWTSLCYGGPMFIIICWWFISAHKWFTGPKVNVEHMMMGRDVIVVDDQEVASVSVSDATNVSSDKIVKS